MNKGDSNPVNDFVTSVVFAKKAFTVTTNLNNIATTNEHDYLLLRNPSASGINALVTHFLVGVDSASSRSVYRIYKNPTISADGTSLSEMNTHFSGSDSSGCSAFKDPTISARGDLMNMKITPSNHSSSGINRWYWLEPGDDLLVTVKNSISNAATFADIYWLEYA